MSDDPPSPEPPPSNPEDTAELFRKSARLRAESKDLARRLKEIQSDSRTNRDALNLVREAAAAHERMRDEVAHRQRAEARLASELAATHLLQRLSSQLIREEEGNTLYKHIVETAMTLMRSECGSMQILEPRTNSLRLLAWKGFHPDAARFWETITAGAGTACGASLKRGERICLRDVRACDWLVGSPHLNYFELCGIRALQSTPLVSRSGEMLGMISTHWGSVHEPSERDLRFLDLLARQAADLLERRRHLDALQASENRLAAIFSQASVGLAEIGLDGQVQTANDELCRILGRTREQMVAVTVADVTHPDDLAACQRAFGRAIETSEPAELEKRFVRADGTVVWGSSRLTRLDDAAGQPRAVLAVLVDLTARLQAEEALAKSREHLRALVESASEHAILTLDLDRRVATWNHGAETIFGYTTAEMIGGEADRIFTAEDRAAGIPGEEMRTALEKGRANDDRWLQRKDGSRFYANGAMAPMRVGADDRVVGFVKILRDETEKHEARQAVEAALHEAEQARAEAEAAGQAKDHFLAVLSHELRTPLTPVLMCVDVLEESESLSPAGLEALAMMRENTRLEAHLIDDLLDVTRIGRGKFQIVPAVVDLHQIVEQAIVTVRPEMAEREQRFTVRLEAQNTVISGDAARLRQVVWNLLKNASKFTPDGGEIRLRTFDENGWVAVEVTDTGIGLEAAETPFIFDAFAQANHTITRQFGGLGLGLAIAKAIVDAHQGKLQVTSPGKNRGATFRMKLPVPSAETTNVEATS